MQSAAPQPGLEPFPVTGNTGMYPDPASVDTTNAC